MMAVISELQRLEPILAPVALLVSIASLWIAGRRLAHAKLAYQSAAFVEVSRLMAEHRKTRADLLDPNRLHPSWDALSALLAALNNTAFISEKTTDLVNRAWVIELWGQSIAMIWFHPLVKTKLEETAVDGVVRYEQLGRLAADCAERWPGIRNRYPDGNPPSASDDALKQSRYRRKHIRIADRVHLGDWR